MQAVFNVIKSTPIWEKENKSTYKPRSKTNNKSAPYQQAVKQIMQPAHELYDELKQNHEFERRLVLMVEECKLRMQNVGPVKAKAINLEILALHGRLGRCRRQYLPPKKKFK